MSRSFLVSTVLAPILFASILFVSVLVLDTAWDPKPAGLPPSTEWQASLVNALAPMPAAIRPPAGLVAALSPHATDVTELGLAAPAADRLVDPSHRVTGTITLASGLEGRVHDGGAVFVIAKRALGGVPSGPPLAVARLDWKAALSFALTEREAMIAGTELAGDVIVMVRYDQDGDALTKQAGDVTGQVRVTVPADAMALVLDTVLP